MKIKRLDRRRTLLSYERETPSKGVHEIGQPVWMGCRVELSDIKNVAFILEDSGLIIVDVKIIRGREERHDRGETSRPRLAIHTITIRRIMT